MQTAKRHVKQLNMTNPFRPPLLIVADSPEGLTGLGGISLLERTRRVALHRGFPEAAVSSNCAEAMSEQLCQQAWHRSDLSLTILARRAAHGTLGAMRDCLGPLH